MKREQSRPWQRHRVINVDYVECDIKVRDISKVNTVIGIGTTLHKFYTTNGEPIWLPCLSYHLPSAEVRLFSPQTYHILYGGCGNIRGDHVAMLVDNHTIKIGIERRGPNVPVVEDSYVDPHEMNRLAPLVKFALSSVDRHTDLFAGFGLHSFNEWKIELEDISEDLFSYPSVLSDSNADLSEAQKYLLLWINCTGISGHRLQELMRPVPIIDDQGVHSMMSLVLPPFCSSSRCKIPKDQTSLLAKA